MPYSAFLVVLTASPCCRTLRISIARRLLMFATSCRQQQRSALRLQRRWQLLPELKTKDDFWEMPRYSADFALLGLEIDGPIRSSVSLEVGSVPYSFTLDVPRGLIVRTELCDEEGLMACTSSKSCLNTHRRAL